MLFKVVLKLIQLGLMSVVEVLLMEINIRSSKLVAITSNEIEVNILF